MYAIVKTGGKQYKVAVGDIVEVEKLDGAAGASVSLPALLVVDGADVTTDAAALARVTRQRRGRRAGQGPEDQHPEVQEQDRLQAPHGPPPEADSVRVTAIETGK